MELVTFMGYPYKFWVRLSRGSRERRHMTTDRKVFSTEIEDQGGTAGQGQQMRPRLAWIC